MATSLNTMSGIGIINYEKAKMLFSRRAKGRNYKVLSDSWTRLQIVPKGDYNRSGDDIFGVYKGTELLFTVHRNGWRIWNYTTWDVSGANRLNSFVPANFYGVYGRPVVGDNDRNFQSGMFIDYTDEHKYPIQWAGWNRWKGIPHAANSSFDLSSQDPEGRDTHSAAKLLRLMCYAYVQNYLNYWEQQGIKSWSAFCDTSSFTGYASFELLDREFKTDTLIDRLHHDEHGVVLQGMKAITGRICSVDGHCPETVNLNNSLGNAQRILRPFRRYVWGDKDGPHVHPFIWSNGQKFTVDHLCYEVNRRQATMDLLAYISYGSQLSNQWYVDSEGMHPGGPRTPDNAPSHLLVYTAGPYNATVPDFVSGFKECEDFSDFDYNACLRIRTDDNPTNCCYVGSVSTLYPRVLLLDVLCHLGLSKSGLLLEGSDIFKKGSHTRARLFDEFYGLLRSKVSPYFIPVADQSMVIDLITNHADSNNPAPRHGYHGSDVQKLTKGRWEQLLADFGITEEDV
jgi:hypothetical protein